MRAPTLNLVGQKFNRLSVVSFSHKNSRGEKYWHCVCDCGNEKDVRANVLTSGKAQSCGCYHLERVTSHGMTNTRTFKSWHSMIDRCTNPNNPSFDKYGGRGISICKGWRESFESFLADMGERPDGKSLDRVDVNGNYEPSNCRWATALEQSINKVSSPKLTFNGVTKTVFEWASEVGVPAKQISWRINNGWPVDMALTTPLTEGRGKKRTPNNL